MRVERIGSATLYNGDAREVLPSIRTGLAKPDLICTDPPYGIGWDDNRQAATDEAGRSTNKGRWRDFGEPTGWDRERPVDVIRYLAGWDIPMIVWGGNYYTDVLPPRAGWLIWDKGQDNFSVGDAELAWTSATCAIRRIVYPRARAIKEGGWHPSQKPIVVMDWCVNGREGHRVLDPFMGSGTTGIACANLNREFIGIETNPDYFDSACIRIRAAQAQLRLFA